MRLSTAAGSHIDMLPDIIKNAYNDNEVYHPPSGIKSQMINTYKSFNKRHVFNRSTLSNRQIDETMLMSDFKKSSAFTKGSPRVPLNQANKSARFQSQAEGSKPTQVL